MLDSQTDNLATREIKPSILYYGTPVILLTTQNEDGSSNISPLSSSWALGKTIVLGIGTGSKALENLQRNPECVINLPGPHQAEQVERLAPLTGKDPIPAYKQAMGYRFEKNKFAAAGLTPVPSLTVKPVRIYECPLQIEATAELIHTASDPQSGFCIVETKALHVHAHEAIIAGEHHIDPQRWSPLIYNFRHYFGLGTPIGKNFRAET